MEEFNLTRIEEIYKKVKSEFDKIFKKKVKMLF